MKKETTMPSKALITVYEWMDSVVAAFLLVVLLFTFIFGVVSVKGTSMEDSFLDSDKVIISNLFYHPQPGDVVIISLNEKNDERVEEAMDDRQRIIKRVIAVGGQKVRIDFNEGIVYVDDQPLDEPYTKTPTNLAYDLDFSENVTVPDGCVFVLGDNRNGSQDSRYSAIGMIDERYILGKVLFRFYSERDGFDRIGVI